MSESVIQIDEQAEIQKIIRQLNTLPNQLKAPGVLASAINATANEMKRKIGQRTRKRYAISDKKILTDRKQGGMYLERATGTSTEATLISMGGMVEVMRRGAGQDEPHIQGQRRGSAGRIQGDVLNG